MTSLHWVSKRPLVMAAAFAMIFVAWAGAPAPMPAQLKTADRVELPGFWPTKGAAPRDEYVGPAACAECHKPEAATQTTTQMARTFVPAASSDVLRAHDRLTFHSGPYIYQIATVGGSSVLSITDGARSISVPLVFAFGVGKVGQTYLFDRKGTFYEGRVSYFDTIQALDFTPGRALSAPECLEDALGRPVDAAETRLCFGCHTTASTTGNRLGPQRLIPGVTCEACHGPGAKHVAAMKAGRIEQGLRLIFNPGQLNPVDSVDFCGACHGTSGDAVSDAGMVLPLALRSQPYQLQVSRCWGKGDARITCIACHDPHQPLVRNLPFYDERCLRCHLRKAGTEATRDHPGAACPVGTDNCVTCHMPKYAVPGMHFKFTDHFIGIARTGVHGPK